MTNPSELPGRRGPLEGEPARLHPAVLGVWLLQSLLPLVVLTFIALPVAVLFLGFVALTAGTRYLRFRWRLEPDALVIDEGLLIRKRRVIRRERIQSVDLERGIPHRIFGVVEVRIEAIGAGGTEGKLDAVAPALADEIRSVLLAKAPGRSRSTSRSAAVGVADGVDGAGDSEPGEGGAGEGAEELAGVSGGGTTSSGLEQVRTVVPVERLVTAGLTGGRVGIAAAIVGFLFQSIPEPWWTDGLGMVLESGPDPTSIVGLRVLLVLALFALLAGFFLSVVGTVFTHWDFTLSEGPDTLAVRRGLFTEHRDTVPYRRIQAVLVEENLVRRILGLGLVRVVVAGRIDAGGNEGTDLLLPIGNRDEIYSLARDVVGVEGEGPPELRRMPWRARSRRYIRALVAALLVAGVVLAVLRFRGDPLAWEWVIGVFGAVILPGMALAEGAYRGLGWADLGDYIVVREGVLNRRTSFLRTDRLQVLETTANPFQRMAGLASLQLRVARPMMAFSPRSLDMGGEDAARWREDLGTRVRFRPSS